MPRVYHGYHPKASSSTILRRPGITIGFGLDTWPPRLSAPWPATGDDLMRPAARHGIRTRMDKRILLLVPLLLAFLLFLSKCGRYMGIEYSSGVQGPIEVVDLPQPSAPSRVFGIGEAMARGQTILLFRQTRKVNALPHNERNFFFICKLLESYGPTVKVIELPTSVSYPQGDYFADIMDRFPGNGYGVIKKEVDGYKLYTSTFGYSEEYDGIVTPVKDSIEQVLGPCPFDRSRIIDKRSRYEPFNKAMKDNRSLILYSFAITCGRFPPAEQTKLEQSIKSRFSSEAEIVLVDHKAFTDPANELYSQANNIVCVYNSHTRKTSPALFSGQDTMANIRRLLDER